MSQKNFTPSIGMSKYNFILYGIITSHHDLAIIIWQLIMV